MKLCSCVVVHLPRASLCWWHVMKPVMTVMTHMFPVALPVPLRNLCEMWRALAPTQMPTKKDERPALTSVIARLLFNYFPSVFSFCCCRCCGSFTLWFSWSVFHNEPNNKQVVDNSGPLSPIAFYQEICCCVKHWDKGIAKGSSLDPHLGGSDETPLSSLTSIIAFAVPSVIAFQVQPRCQV